MKIKKGFLILSGLSVLMALAMSVGGFNHSAQAAGQPAELESFSIEQESAAAVCTPDADGMVAYWPLDDGLEQLNDVIANTAFNNGVCVSGTCPISNLSGKVASALMFDGNDEISVADTSGLEFTIGGDMSIETWVKTTQDCTGNKVFVGRYEGLPMAAWWLGCYGASQAALNKAAFHMRDSAGKELSVIGTSVINDGQWHHIVGTRDGTANINKIYVDGVLENSGTPAFTGELTFTSKPVTIGYFAPDPYYWYDGTLDEMALYDQALAADVVSRHYLDGQGQSYCNADLPIPGGVTFQTLKDTPKQFTESELLVNDVAPDGGLNLVSISPTSVNGGTISGSNPYIYTPPPGFLGNDNFNYVIADGDGEQATGTATVQVLEEIPLKNVYLPLLLKNYSP
jgi:hypothetical protein